jgi:hypothetical protein
VELSELLSVGLSEVNGNYRDERKQNNVLVTVKWLGTIVDVLVAKGPQEYL